MQQRVFVYDTTLRDGAQNEGVSFTIGDKLEMVRRLDAFGVDYIEGGWPGSNEKDLAFFEELKSVPLKHSKVVAFTSTRRKNQRIQTDDHMQSVLGTGLKHCAVVGKTWDFHVERALRTSLAENLSMISDTVAFLKERGIEVLFDAEHFFDAYKHNRDYALQALAAARDNGADWLILCDTNGGTLPHEISSIVQEVMAEGFGPLGIHTHNDGGLAVANTLAAVQAGATQVQGTINGFGERCGNADLCAVIPNLVLKMGVPCHLKSHDLRGLRGLSQRLYEMTRRPAESGQPFVGPSAFAHKAGIHVSAVVRDPALYEHIDPSVVGNERRVLVSELSGESNVLYQLRRLGLPVSEDAPGRILGRLKSMEYAGYSFDSAHTSLELVMREELGLLKEEPFRNVEVGIEPVPAGYAAKVRWKWHGDAAGGLGHGVSPAQAMVQAIRPLLADLHLDEEQVVAVQLGHGLVHRALIRATWHGESLAAVGLAEDAHTATAKAVTDLARHVALMLEVSQANESRRAASPSGNV